MQNDQWMDGRDGAKGWMVATSSHKINSNCRTKKSRYQDPLPVGYLGPTGWVNGSPSKKKNGWTFFDLEGWQMGMCGIRAPGEKGDFGFWLLWPSREKLQERDRSIDRSQRHCANAVGARMVVLYFCALSLWSLGGENAKSNFALILFQRSFVRRMLVICTWATCPGATSMLPGYRMGSFAGTVQHGAIL